MIRTVFISLAVLASGLLSGCGFAPLHAATATSAPMANLNVQLEKGGSVIDNQAGFLVAQRLRDRVGNSSETSPYTLKITPRYRRTRLGVTSGDVASRYDISITAAWELFDSNTGETLEKDRANSVVTFGAPAGPYGVIQADNVGIEQAAKEAADRLIIQLAGYFAAENKN